MAAKKSLTTLMWEINSCDLPDPALIRAAAAEKMNDRQKTVVLTKALNHLTTGAALTKISSSVMQVKVAEDFGLNIGRQAVFKQLKARGLIQASPTKSHKRKIPLPPAKPKPPLPEPKNIPSPKAKRQAKAAKKPAKKPAPKKRKPPAAKASKAKRRKRV